MQINARTGKRSTGSNWLAVCDAPVTSPKPQSPKTKKKTQTSSQ